MTPQIQTIIFVVLALIAGYVFGLLDKWVTGSLRKKPDDDRSSQKAEAAPHAPHEVNLPGERTVLKVTRDLDQKWKVELDGIRIEKPEEISPDQRQRVVNVVMQIRPWLEGKAVQVQGNAAPLRAAAAPQPAAPVPAQPRPEPIKALTPAAPAQRQDNLKISPVRGLSEMITKDVKAVTEKKPASIVGMIDEVLQARLPSTPYKDAGIRLEDGLMGEVIVVVGSQSYKGLDSVPDAEIRNLIRAAIAEWEKK